MKTLFVIAATAAAASLATVAPASAEPRSPKPTAEAAAQDGIPASKKLREQRVCFVDKLTGSNIPTKQCNTRDGWQAMGVKLPAGI